MFTNQQIGAAVRSIRQKLNVKSVKLATTLGVSSAVISRIEHGKQQLPFGLAVEICESLGVEVNALVEEAGNIKDNPELNTLLDRRRAVQQQLRVLNDEIESLAGRN